MSVKSRESLMKDLPSPPRCRLLGLPRELRDHIYSYLSPDEEPDWTHMQLFLLPPAQVRFHNTLLLSLLHTHPQLRAEYLEAPWAKNVSVTLRMGVESGPFGSLGHMQKDLKTVPTLPVDMICYHFLHHVTILVDCGHAHRSAKPPNELHWASLKGFAIVLADHAPNLTTIKIGMQYHAYHMDRQFGTNEFLPAPLTPLGTFELVQRCEGYRYDQEDIRILGPVSPPGTRPRTVPPGAPNTMVVNGLVKNGAYLYIRGEAQWAKQCWTQDEVVALFPVRPYTRGWDVDNDAPWVRRHGMKDWRERRGIVDTRAWF